MKVRVEIENPQDLLMPGMYANLRIEHDMGRGLLIPESIVLRTGERSLAFRVLPEGRFEPVAIEFGRLVTSFVLELLVNPPIYAVWKWRFEMKQGRVDVSQLPIPEIRGKSE